MRTTAAAPPVMESSRHRFAIALAALLILALGGLGLGLPACQALDEPDPSDAAGITVPFEMLPSNHMVIETRINGEGPYRLIFDVGAPVTLLSNQAAEDSGVVERGAARSLLFGMRGESQLETLSVGDLTVEDLPVIVLDHPAVRALSRAFRRPIDGIIGYTFFARYKTTIDYQTREMTFAPVDFEVRNLLAELPDRLTPGPKPAVQRVLAPRGLWGLRVGAPHGGLEAQGVPITAVLPGSAAEAAGLQPGDLMTTLDGRWTVAIADVYEAAAAIEPGQTVEVVVLRDGQEHTLRVTPRPGI